MAKALDKEIAVFVKFHLADRHAFAPFTGTDFPAWKAFLHLVQLWGNSRSPDAVMAMRATLNAAQAHRPDVMAVFKKSIPGVLDWGHEPELWKQIAPEVMPRNDIDIDFGRVVAAQGYTAKRIIWPCEDGPRICSHIHSKPSKKHAGYFVCKDCGTEWRLADGEEASP